MSSSTTSITMIPIGQGRRLTLSELYLLSSSSSSASSSSSSSVAAAVQMVQLQWHDTTAAASASATGAGAGAVPEADITNLSLIELDDLSNFTSSSDSIANDETVLFLSIQEIRAFLILFAFQLVQIEGNDSIVSRKLVQYINSSLLLSSNIIRLPRDVSIVVQVMQQWIPELVSNSNSSFNTTTMIQLIQRCYELAIVAIAVYKATILSNTVTLPIAALTVDCSGLASTILQKEQYYNEITFDTLRPHRSMITAAATLRSILNDTRYTSESSSSSTNTTNIQQKMAFCDLPQYHGPITEQLQITYKQMELEINCRSNYISTTTSTSNVGDNDNSSSSNNNNVLPLDPTVIELCTKRTISSIQLQLMKSIQRQGGLESIDNLTEDTINTMSLSELVSTYEMILSKEAYKAMKHIQTVTATAAAAASDAMKKDENNETEQQQQQRGNTTAVEDEFAGKSEAAIAKILKIRKEKEEKAAAKRRMKEQKQSGGTSLFGAGTQVLYNILLPYYMNNTNTTNTSSSPESGMIPLLSSSGGNNSNQTLVQQISNAVDTLLSGGLQRKPKIPKGTRDYLPDQMMIRQQAFTIIRRVFESHGAVEIDTPVFELKDTLTGKYGEDSKLIYDLADQGGELLALRYDLTVPFARFLALNNVGNIKRFHIGKVYRRDQPALKRGRYREFYQCDFDIAGTYGRMIPDSECLCVVCDILHALPIGEFAIKVNHRCLLDAILDICGVPADKFRTICSAVDKLDKEPWSEVKREMVEDKGLQEHVADKIGEFVLNKGSPLDLYKELMDSKRFGDHAGAAVAMEDLRILFEYLEAFDKLKFMSFDLSLARGLDYYTGVIYEAVCMSGTTQVGSIGGGGRYDNLVSMFQESGKQTPCVGVSVGIERVFTLMEARMREEHQGSIQQPHVSVLIASAGGAMMKEKMTIARILWDASISAEFSHQENAKLKKEVVHALDRNIPFMVVIGENEMAENKVQVKNIQSNTAELVNITDLVSTLRTMGVIPVGCEFAYELLNKGS